MDLISLKTFQAVVKEGGILSASRTLHTVQSNVTTRIKRLEEELGTKLFYRKGRGLEITPAGRILLDYSYQLLHLENQAVSAVQQAVNLPSQLSIGSMETFAALKLAAVLKRLKEFHPQLKLHVTTDLSDALIEQVLEHKLDCAFVGGYINHPDLVTVEVSTEQLVLVRPKDMPDHPLPLILFREGCTYRGKALAWQAAHGECTSDVMEMGTLEGILSCVSVGIGCTLMPHWVLTNSPYKDDLDISVIDTEFATVPTLLIWHKNTITSKALEALKLAATSI